MLFRSFVAGTRIATVRGEIAVERLRVSDKVRAVLSGRWEPVTWIGRRVVDVTRHPRKDDVWPIRVAAHTFGSMQPGRDLWLSPHHGVYVGDALIPIGLLVDDRSIRRIHLPAVAYWHVELARHEVLLAEGLAAESYLDLGDRTDFLGAQGAFVSLFPSFGARRHLGEGCAPWVVDGPELDAARALIAERADLVARLAAQAAKAPV